MEHSGLRSVTGMDQMIRYANRPVSKRGGNILIQPIKGNPHNWSARKKFYHCAIPTAIAFLCPFGSSVYTPGIDQVVKEFDVSREVALLPFVFYLLGLSFGPIVAGPSSETFGRKAVYTFALPGVAAFTLGAGFSQNITSLIICRAFAGLFASPGLSIGMAMVSDFLPPEKRGGPVAIFITMVQMGRFS